MSYDNRTLVFTKGKNHYLLIRDSKDKVVVLEEQEGVLKEILQLEKDDFLKNYLPIDHESLLPYTTMIFFSDLLVLTKDFLELEEQCTGTCFNDSVLNNNFLSITNNVFDMYDSYSEGNTLYDSSLNYKTILTVKEDNEFDLLIYSNYEAALLYKFNISKFSVERELLVGKLLSSYLECIGDSYSDSTLVSLATKAEYRLLNKELDHIS